MRRSAQQAAQAAETAQPPEAPPAVSGGGPGAGAVADGDVRAQLVTLAAHLRSTVRLCVNDCAVPPAGQHRATELHGPPAMAFQRVAACLSFRETCNQ